MVLYSQRAAACTVTAGWSQTGLTLRSTVHSSPYRARRPISHSNQQYTQGKQTDLTKERLTILLHFQTIAFKTESTALSLYLTEQKCMSLLVLMSPVVGFTKERSYIQSGHA